MSCERHEDSETERRFLTPVVSVLLTFVLLSLMPGKGASEQEKARDSCVECHGQPSFLVTNKKLYDYYQRWNSSVHKQEGVTCVDCHGGNPRSSDKKEAHGGDLGEAGADSAVNFRNIPKTCGGCHRDIYAGFRESTHFEHVVAEKLTDQGPTCVTCHGSLNVAALNVNTVEEVCRNCHNDETQNSPENPERARALLNRFLSIHRYYRYIAVRADPEDARRFFGEMDRQIGALTVSWHTFDLDEIGAKTEAVLRSLKEKREAVADAGKKRSDDRRR